MFEITIINFCFNSIKLYAVYTEHLELLPSIKTTTFFSNGNFKTITIPNNSRDVSITVDILDEKGIAIPVRSFKFDNSITDKKENTKKLFQFVGYKNLSDVKDYFFDIIELPLNVNFNLRSFIKFQNKSSSTAKCNIIFQIDSKEFKIESNNIKSKKNFNIYFPFNCNYIQLKFFRLNTLKNLQLVELFRFTNMPVKKCYTLSSNLINTSFSIKENSCP